jgi:RNA-directed DNA polymerase
VVQTAVKLVVEPIFEADFEPNTYGYRPRRSAAGAIKAVHELLCQGYTDVVDADLSKYFDTIPHAELMQSIARRVVDRDILGLIKMWLKVPVEERDGNGRRRVSGGKASRCGTPQGGVLAPRTQKITFGPGWSGVCMVGRRAVGWASRQGDGVSNDDFIIANEDFLHEKPKNMLTFRYSRASADDRSRVRKVVSVSARRR